MLIPSIDLMGGRIVQLERGEELRLAFDDFEYWIERFCRYSLVQLIDLDAAKRTGDNRALIEQIAKRLPVQVGGGIRTRRTGPGAPRRRRPPGHLRFGPLPRGRHRRRVAAAVSSQNRLSAICRSHRYKSRKNRRPRLEGQRRPDACTGHRRHSNPWCGAFLYTHVDTEGTMRGFPIEIARRSAPAHLPPADRRRRHSRPVRNRCPGCPGRGRRRWHGCLLRPSGDLRSNSGVARNFRPPARSKCSKLKRPVRRVSSNDDQRTSQSVSQNVSTRSASPTSCRFAIRSSNSGPRASPSTPSTAASPSSKRPTRSSTPT